MTDSLKTKVNTRPPVILYSSYIQSNAASSNSILKNKYDYVNRISSTSPLPAAKLKEVTYSQTEFKNIISKYEGKLKTMAEGHASQKQRLQKYVKDLRVEMIPMINILLKNSSMLDEYKKTRQNLIVSADRDIYNEYSLLKQRLQRDCKKMTYKFITKKHSLTNNINPEISDKFNKLSTVNILSIKVMPTQKENLFYLKEKTSIPKSQSVEKSSSRHMSAAHQKVHRLSHSFEIDPATLLIFEKRIRHLEHQLREEIMHKRNQTKLIEQLNEKIVLNDIQSLNSRWKAKNSSFYYN